MTDVKTIRNQVINKKDSLNLFAPKQQYLENGKIAILMQQ